MSAKTDTEAKNMYYEALEVSEATHCLLTGQLGAPEGWVRPQSGQGETRKVSPGSTDICASLPHAQKLRLRQVRPFVQDLIGSDSVL